MTNHMGQRKIE